MGAVEKHRLDGGAVKWIQSQWNLLVERPEYTAGHQTVAVVCACLLHTRSTEEPCFKINARAQSTGLQWAPGEGGPLPALVTGTAGDPVPGSTDHFLRNTELGAEPTLGGSFSQISQGFHPRSFLLNKKRKRASVCTCACGSPPHRS